MSLPLRFSLFLLAILASCANNLPRPKGIPTVYATEQVPQAIEDARDELLRKDGTSAAVAHLAAAQAAPRLTTEQSATIQVLLVEAVSKRLEELRGSNAADEMEALAELELPRDLAVRASLATARAMLNLGERVDCHEYLVKVDGRYPLHARRAESGRLLFEAGRSLATDQGTYFWFMSYRPLATPVLEYFVQNHPEHADGPEAYALLATIYEEGRSFAEAIRRNRDLLLEYPGSFQAIAARARIPHLRLAQLSNPEYDRTEMKVAREELISWLDDNASHAMADEVRIDLADCMQRLTDSDLAIARFYETIENPAGFEFHARRALEEAREGGNEKQITEAFDLLAQATQTGAP
jgi:hypothetical protein